jgi:O-antigen/teichoic acid export membrane protein
MPSALKTRILRGVGATALGQVANAVIQLVSLPVFLAVWGVEQYGEWLVLSSLAAFLSMSDIGFATAAANEMTMRVGRGDREGAVTVYHSMWALLTGLGLAVLAVLLAVLWATPAAGWLAVKTISPGEVAAVLSVLAAYILLGLQLGVVNAGFRCDGNFALGQLLGTGQRLAEFAAQIGAAAATQSMLAVATAGLAVRCASLVVCLAVLKRKSPWLPLGVSGANAVTVRELLVPALSFMGMPLGHALSNQGMIQVVAATIGPAAVTVFTAHRTICNIATQLVNMLAVAVWPEFSTSLGADDRATSRRLHRAACRWSIWLGLTGCVALAVVGPLLIPFWTQGKIACNVPLFAALLADVVVRIAWWTSSVVPMSTNSHQRMSLTYLGCTSASLVLAIALIPALGLAGAAVSLLVIDVAMVTYVLPASLAAVDDRLSEFLRSVLSFPVRPRPV